VLATTPAVGPIAEAISYTSTSSIDLYHGPVAFRITMGFAITYVALELTLLGTVAGSIAMGVKSSAIVVRSLRLLLSLGATILFLPVESALLRGLSCPALDGNMWMGTQVACDSGGRALIGVGLCILAGMHFVVSLVVVAEFGDSNPASQSLTARNHGRLEALALAVNLVLAVLFDSFHESVANSSAMAVILIVVGIAMTALWGYR